MQSANKTDLVYCLCMLEAIGKIDLYASDYENPYVFFDANDQKDFNACLLLLLHIGERAFRNLVAHDYVGIDRLVVFETIRYRLPDLKLTIEHIIRTEMQQGTFDEIDYSLSKQSNYYRHINFDNIA